MNFNAILNNYQKQIEAALINWVPSSQTRPTVLHKAMRYSLDAGGKRLRPCLVLAAHAILGSNHDPMPAAVAIECMHTYSLIHDDLPCMDNADLRRGRPSCHKQFDEATALLAGDALLTHALWMLANAYRDEARLATDLLEALGKASGSECLIGGQMEDLLGEYTTPTSENLEFIHRNKTAALISCSLFMGLRLTEASAEKLMLIRKAGMHLGLAFQIIDDILDATSDAETMGKPVRADEANKKMTYPAFYGLEASHLKAQEHTHEAIQAFETIGGQSQFLIELARYMENRIH